MSFQEKRTARSILGIQGQKSKPGKVKWSLSIFFPSLSETCFHLDKLIIFFPHRHKLMKFFLSTYTDWSTLNFSFIFQRTPAYFSKYLLIYRKFCENSWSDYYFRGIEAFSMAAFLTKKKNHHTCRIHKVVSSAATKIIIISICVCVCQHDLFQIGQFEAVWKPSFM